MAATLAVWADVIALAPELAPIVDVAVQTTWLRIASRFVPVSGYGIDTTDAHAALTAHLLSVSPAGEALGIVGRLASEADGPSSRSFALAAMSDELLSSTTYGQIYMALRRLARVGRGLIANTELDQ
jgi:hypothetical protein